MSTTTSSPRYVASLTTPRLVLRVPTLDDAPLINQHIHRSFPELHEWMDWAMDPPPLEQTQDYCRRSIESWERGEDFPALMFLRDSGDFVGSTGLVRTDHTVPRVEIGYWCTTEMVGQGYVTEATRELARYAFEDLNAVRVELRMDERNVRSWAVPERLGFAHEATLKHDTRANDGSLRSTRVYAMFDRADLQ